MPHTTIAIALIVIGLGLVLWAYLLARKRRRQRSLVGVSLLGPIVMALGGLLTAGGGAVLHLLAPLPTMSFTINSVAGVNPNQVGFNDALMRGDQLLNCRVAPDSNVFKGELSAYLISDSVTVWAFAAGESNQWITCNFTYKGKAQFTKDQELKEISPGKYSFKARTKLISE